VIFILLLSTATADTVISDEKDLDAESYEHISFDTSNNFTMVITGEVDYIIDLIVFKGQNYEMWLNQTSHSRVAKRSLNDTVPFEYEVEIDNIFVNTTIHVVFVNLYNHSVHLKYQIDEILTTEGFLAYPILFIPIVLVSLARFRSNYYKQ
jgi:hypothetical protein